MVNTPLLWGSFGLLGLFGFESVSTVFCNWWGRHQLIHSAFQSRRPLKNFYHPFSVQLTFSFCTGKSFTVWNHEGTCWEVWSLPCKDIICYLPCFISRSLPWARRRPPVWQKEVHWALQSWITCGLQLWQVHHMSEWWEMDKNNRNMFWWDAFQLKITKCKKNTNRFVFQIYAQEKWISTIAQKSWWIHPIMLG